MAYAKIAICFFIVSVKLSTLTLRDFLQLWQPLALIDFAALGGVTKPSFRKSRLIAFFRKTMAENTTAKNFVLSLIFRMLAMPETAPLYFESRLGMLSPVNAAAQAAMRDIQGRVRVEIKQTRGNVRRNALYWSALSVAVPMLEDRLEGAQLTVDMMHRILKRKHGLARPVVNKQTGEIIDYDYDSIRFASMPENDRSEYITAALGTLSKMLGVEVQELMKEAENA